jgi:predicted nucleic acid-binding protein
MDRLIDSGIWIAAARPKTQMALRTTVLHQCSHPHAALCEPVIFELRRHCPDADAGKIEPLIQTTPLLATPQTLWRDAALLGATLRRQGLLVPAIDLLVAQIALHHGAVVVTLDRHFLDVKKVSSLQVELVA